MAIYYTADKMPSMTVFNSLLRCVSGARGFLALVMALGLSACSGSDLGLSARWIDDDAAQFVDQPFSNDSVDVFAEGYHLISDRYIEPVNLGTVIADGLGGLSAIDSSLSAAYEQSYVRIYQGNQQLYEFAVLQTGEPGELAEETFDAIEVMRAASSKLADKKSEAVYAAFFAGAISGLDSYTRYAGSERARENRAQRDGYGGIGIRIEMGDNRIKIAGVMEATPAALAGLKDQDAITHVDGTPVAGLDLPGAVRLLRGPIGSKVRLTIERESRPTPFDVDVRREHIVPPTVAYNRVGDIAHIRISRFNQRTADSLKNELREIRNETPAVQGIILDLRDNPGGLLDQAIEIADIFLTDGLIITTHGRHHDSHQRFEASGIDFTDGIPMVVLLNEHSASAAEIVGAALQDNNRAVVVGTTSFGKGTVQTVFRLPNSGELTLTWSRIFAPSGYVLHGLGILPTVCTADHTPTPRRLLEDARRNRTFTQGTFRDWRASTSVNDPNRPNLRKVCLGEKTTEEIDYELETARLVLESKNVYEQALGLSTAQVAVR